MEKRFIIPLLSLVIILGGCNSALKGIMGIKDVKPIYPADLPDFSIEFNISPDALFLIDTTAFVSFLSTLPDTGNLKHDLYQPLQIMAFDSSGHKYLHLVNCSIGGFKSLKWNKYETFEHFPLSAGKFYNSDTTINLDQTLSFFYKSEGIGVSTPDYSTADEIIVVFWANFMKSQSQRLLDLLNGYEKKFANKDIRVYYVVTDNLYLNTLK
jgi:hypothetical protein